MIVINNFSGDYDFLSNFYNINLVYDKILYHSSEAAYQAAKTLDNSKRLQISNMGPAEAKKAGRQLQLRPDWEEIKDKIMYDICLIKFTTSLSLASKLLATNDTTLIEGNHWHDNYWGDCSCKKCKNIHGNNQLGKTLMQIRDVLQERVYLCACCESPLQQLIFRISRNEYKKYRMINNAVAFKNFCNICNNRGIESICISCKDCSKFELVEEEEELKDLDILY